jgi:hypothetical protein
MNARIDGLRARINGMTGRIDRMEVGIGGMRPGIDAHGRLGARPGSATRLTQPVTAEPLAIGGSVEDRQGRPVPEIGERTKKAASLFRHSEETPNLRPLFLPPSFNET